MRRFVYDTEVFPNYILFLFKNIDTKEYIEISSKKNNLSELRQFGENDFLISYNGLAYDDLMLNFTKANPNLHVDKYKEFSDYIIQDKNDPNYYQKIRKYKYSKFKSIDLLKMLFSLKLRVSLKSLQVLLKWHNVLESDIPFNSPVDDKDIPTVFNYCENDVDFTEYLAEYCKKDIQLRFEIERTQGLNCLNMDGVKLGAELYIKSIANKLDTSQKEIRNIRGSTKPFYLKEIVLPFIKFKDPILKNLLKRIKEFKYHHRINYFSDRVIFRKTIYDIGSGGLKMVSL